MFNLPAKKVEILFLPVPNTKKTIMNYPLRKGLCALLKYNTGIQNNLIFFNRIKTHITSSTITTHFIRNCISNCYLSFFQLKGKTIFSLTQKFNISLDNSRTSSIEVKFLSIMYIYLSIFNLNLVMKKFWLN
jgi:hypothetical protein